MVSQLIDLDELVLRCEGEEAKLHMLEAVSCYKVGAFRSCIVSTWIAVVFDYIDKLRQLELTDDANARKRLNEFEAIRQDHDLKKSLEFERGVLDVAKDEFELLSPLEHDELMRLFEDRHRCAHPSMRSLDEPYEPTAETARYHMRNAVTFLFQYPPTQGKVALNSLVRQVESSLFPTIVDDIKKVFQRGPLARPRQALVRNFVLVLLKGLLLNDHIVTDYQLMMRFIGALEAVLDMHRDLAEQTCTKHLSTIIGRVEDHHLERVLMFLFYLQKQIWDFVAEDVRIRLGLFIENLPSTAIESALWHALGIRLLKKHALIRLESVNEDELPQLFDEPEEEVVDKAVQVYVKARNWPDANSKAQKLIFPIVNHLKDRHIEMILKAGLENYEIFGSREFVPVLFAIRDAQGDRFGQFEPLVVELREEADTKHGRPKNPFRRFMPSDDTAQTQPE